MSLYEAMPAKTKTGYLGVYEKVSAEMVGRAGFEPATN